MVSFPSEEICSNPIAGRSAAKALLLQLATKRRLALVTITSWDILCERISGEEFEIDELERILDLNKELFSAEHDDAEFRHLRSFFDAQSLVVLGKT